MRKTRRVSRTSLQDDSSELKRAAVPAAFSPDIADANATVMIAGRILSEYLRVVAWRAARMLIISSLVVELLFDVNPFGVISEYRYRVKW